MPFAGLFVVRILETAIGRIAMWSMAEGGVVVLKRNFHVILIVRVSHQHFVLRNQALLALREKYFVAEFLRGKHLATFDQVSVGFKMENTFSALGTFSPSSTRRRA